MKTINVRVFGHTYRQRSILGRGMAATDCVIRLARYFNTTTFVRRADIVRSAGPRGTRSFPCPLSAATRRPPRFRGVAPVPRSSGRPPNVARPPPRSPNPTPRRSAGFTVRLKKTRESLVGPTGFFRSVGPSGHLAHGWWQGRGIPWPVPRKFKIKILA